MSDIVPTAGPSELEQRVIELEIKASFQEDLLDQLNTVIVRQQQHIDMLQRDVRELRDQASHASPSGTDAAPAGTELPPHY